jgi:hypothetical protein
MSRTRKVICQKSAPHFAIAQQDKVKSAKTTSLLTKRQLFQMSFGGRPLF